MSLPFEAFWNATAKSNLSDVNFQMKPRDSWVHGEADPEGGGMGGGVKLVGSAGQYAMWIGPLQVIVFLIF